MHLRFLDRAEKCAARHLPAFSPLALAEPEVEIIHAAPLPKLQFDRNGYFIILPLRERGEIWVEHYRNDGMLQHRLVGSNAAGLCNTIIKRELLTQLDHAAYWGRKRARRIFVMAR